jgi:1-acyl-sn-glycerol-3-phosphate acyltransferase
MPTWYHRASWGLLRVAYAPYLLKKRCVEAQGVGALPDPPFILMSDHSNRLDAYVLGALTGTTIRYMANLEGVPRTKAALALLVGAYGRRKGSSDIAALRETFALSRSGEAIGIFPEGDRSWDGSTLPLRPGSGKLVRRLGVPLVLARQKGNYLAHPRWADHPRRGRWSVEFSVFDADELARMSDALVDSIISAVLTKNEIKDADREGRTFECDRSAEGIGRLLWRCPVCGRVDGIRGAGNLVFCTLCGSRWELDANCRITALNAPLSLHRAVIADLKDWHDWQVRTLPSLACGASPLIKSEAVVLSKRLGAGVQRIGRGRLYLVGWGSGAELVFEGENGTTVFDASSIRGFVDNFNSFSEFDHQGQRWRLEFGGGNALKWAVAIPSAAAGTASDEAA